MATSGRIHFVRLRILVPGVLGRVQFSSNSGDVTELFWPASCDSRPATATPGQECCGGRRVLADLQRKWRRGLSHFRGWGAEFGRSSVAVALWRDEEEREQAQEEGWARYLGLVPAKPGLWHAAFLKINTTVFPFSSPACEPLQLLDFTTQPLTHTHIYTLAFLVP